jgi:uncharacterized protein (DUF885 family)
MRTLLTFLSLLTCGAAGIGSAATPSMADRLAAQNSLFEEQWQASLEESPEFSSYIGDYRHNDRLDDYSLAGIKRRFARDERYRMRLRAISTTGFSEQDQLSHEIMLRALAQSAADYQFREYELPLSQMNGPHLALSDLPLWVPFDSVQHYEDYIARLRQIPRVLKQTEEVLSAGVQAGIVPVRFLLEKVPAQCEGVIAANPFLIPTRKFPEGISPQEQTRLTADITRVVNEQVLPAYKSFAAFVASEYAPRGRTTLSTESLPDGKRRYVNEIRGQTTISDLSAAQIHQIGLREIERIEAQMLVIAHQQGFQDLPTYRAALKVNKKYIPTSSEQILDDYRRYIAQMQSKLPALFGHIPSLPVTVEALPDFQAADSTQYRLGTPDGKRPGRVVVATADLPNRTMVDDEATAYHEGVPGHHMQGSVALEMTTLPKFRQYYSNAGYAEGWALYAEQLGKEVGFYQDPNSDYGRLASDMFRAVRLVVDTGIHSQGWSRERVVEFFHEYAVVDEPTIQAETDRYISWPGQALAYKLGQLKMRELRERAQRELGPKFDVRKFHDELLNGGVVPLDLLSGHIDRWIAASKAGG